MIELYEKLAHALGAVVKKSFPEISAGVGAVQLDIPKHNAFGDISCSLPMKLAKEAHISPMEAAQKLVAALQFPEEFDEPIILAPGFINFSFRKSLLAKIPARILENPAVLKPNIGHGKTIVTDISHPNIAKPMGVHHLLSTVIGGALNRLFSYGGYQVVRDNYLGDWGTQFGKLIYAYRTWGDEKTVLKNPIQELLKLYVKFHDEAEENPALEDEGRKEFKKLEDGDADNKKLWQWIVEVSLKEFHAMWNLLGAEFDVLHGESFYEDKMAAVVEAGIQKKIFTEGEKGALICEFPEEGYSPSVIRKGDGATLYATRDLARIKYWEDTWHPVLMVNVVDVAQKLHFQQLISMTKKLGLTKAPNVHVSFGRMRFPDKKMSTRKGNIVLLDEVIEEMITLARQIVEEKNPELSAKKKEEVAKIVGLGALKFAVLIQNRETDTTFTWEKMLSLEGESAPYVQYAYARAKSILRKAEAVASTLTTGDGKKFLEEKQELELARMFPRFSWIVARSIEEFRPNYLARYLCDVASRFNAFYAEVHVLNAGEGLREERLLLVRATAEVLKIGLDLLGIQVPEEM